MKTRPSLVQPSGFSLLEMLVAMTIFIMLLGLLSYSIGSLSNSYLSSKEKVFSDRDAELALDYIIRDLESLIVPSRLTEDGEGIEALRISPDPSGLNSQWLTLLAVTNDIESDISNGMVRGISYRLGFQDPIDGPGGSGDSEYAIYRKVLTAGDTFDTALLNADPRTEIWENAGIVPELTPVEDYLAAHVVDLRVRFLSGDSRLPPTHTDQLTIRSDGVFINGVKTQQMITGAEVSLTVLSKVGAARIEQGVPLQELISRHARVYTRQTSNLIQPLF